MHVHELAVVGILSVAFFGCSPPGQATCDLIVEEAPQITVVNASTGELICDADMVAFKPGSGDATLVTFIPPSEAGPPDCTYFPASVSLDGSILGGSGALSDGTYTLRASKTGFQTATEPNVVWQSYSCDEPSQPAQVVKISLTPD